MPEWLERLRRIVTVEPAIFFYMTSTFIMLPAYQHLVIVKVCQELYEDSEACKDSGHGEDTKDVQSHSSYILLIYTAVLSSVSIPPALLLGSWSDAAGRRSVMVLPFLLSVLSGGVFMAMALVPSLSVYWCLLAAGLTGLSGGHVSVFLSSFSYLADATTDPGAGRTLRMAVAEAMIFVGGTVGFLLGGFLEQDLGLPAAFAAFITCHILAVFYILLWLRDPTPVSSTLGVLTNDDSVREDLEESEWGLFVLKHARRSFRAVFKRRSGQERLKLHFLILCTFINNLVAIGEQSILLLYLMYEPREFTTEMFGLFNSARMLLLGFGLLGLFPLLLRCFKEMTLAKLGTSFRAASYVLLAFSTNTWMVFLVAVLSAPAGITQAVIRSLSSAIVGPDEQGAMFSFSASVEATCFIFAAVLFNGLYPQTLSTFPGMPFIVMAGFCIIVLILMQWISEMPATHPRLVLPD
ncbi:lysosomal proton-coupled steroid conjugate and bile acid symporter SLC46A3 isoform X2 [Brachyhypopomus gauderio]|uniref:lysosomal proton-coupled steroid conjugate and bile acid symporter SLC46A3 isoform X2 n=1 Tax=Brachyhypopomus gauderio TaxID=698409 RepID=UPI004042D2E5